MRDPDALVAKFVVFFRGKGLERDDIETLPSVCDMAVHCHLCNQCLPARGRDRNKEVLAVKQPFLDTGGLRRVEFKDAEPEVPAF